MFNKLKQFKDLRSQAKQMQNALSGEEVTLDKNGIKITINGNMEITSLVIDKNLTPEKIESAIKPLINDAIKKVQKIMAQKMQQMGGLGNLGM